MCAKRKTLRDYVMLLEIKYIIEKQNTSTISTYGLHKLKSFLWKAFEYSTPQRQGFAMKNNSRNSAF